MSSDYKISIIIPVFNAERFLKEALESIISQTIGFESLEVIMVDDCSTDNSLGIMTDYSEKYDNFKAIHLDKNSGCASKPRNIGLDNATADYIMFLDSDDELIEDVCEKLYYELIEKDADAVTANAICVLDDGEVKDINYADDYYEVTSNRNIDLFKPFRIWGTLFKRSVIEENNLRFIDVATNEDTHFNHNFFFHAGKIVYLNDFMGVKHYERDLDNYISLSHKICKFNVISTIDAFLETLKLIYKYCPSKVYESDPFIKNIFYRFSLKWDMTHEDKIEIFEKILEYEKFSGNNRVLPVHYKIMDNLLNKKMFSLLIVVQKIYCVLVRSRFSKKFLVPKIDRNVVD